MNYREEIEKAIKTGISEACGDSLVFSEDETREIDAEYLLTMSVAKSIAKLNTNFGSPYKLYVERQTKRFCKDCISLTRRVPASNFMGYKDLLRKGSFNTKRNGRIDICVYRNDRSSLAGIPLCAIELKKFGCQSAPAIADLKRNAEYFALSGNTGNSQIQFSIFGALESFPTSLNIKDYKRDLIQLKKQYRHWLHNLKGKASFSVTVESFTVRAGLEVTDFGNGEETLESNHHFAGVLVTFGRRPSGRSGK